MAENTTEKRDNITQFPDKREAGFESEADREQREAAEFSAAKVAAGQAQENFGPEVRPTAQTPTIETILERPQPTKSEDLVEQILSKLEGKTDKEKIEALLSGSFDAAAKNEAMARILEQQDRAA